MEMGNRRGSWGEWGARPNTSASFGNWNDVGRPQGFSGSGVVRIFKGKGGYVYGQDAETGEIVVKAGPARVGERHKASATDLVWLAITREIGAIPKQRAWVASLAAGQRYTSASTASSVTQRESSTSTRATGKGSKVLNTIYDILNVGSGVASTASELRTAFGPQAPAGYETPSADLSTEAFDIIEGGSTGRSGVPTWVFVAGGVTVAAIVVALLARGGRE